MDKFKNLLRTKLSRELISYLIFGVLTTVVSMVTFWFACKAMHYLIAEIISWIFAVTFAFFTNRMFVFQSRGKGILRQMAVFYTARLFSLGVEELGLFVLIDCVGFDEMISKLVLQFVVVVLNYVLSKLVVFR
ncbi:MAG: GtrA family protein [Ruminococcaceae bacterium]|nr:GtrA family protein [Oscillospiraceae bacterium]